MSGANAKCGFFPTNIQVETVLGEFLLRGYVRSIGAVHVKWIKDTSAREINARSVGYVDGFCKVLTMTYIVLAMEHLVPGS